MMPKKCESCQHYVGQPIFGKEFCLNVIVKAAAKSDDVFLDQFTKLDPAREICDTEGDGIFVFFQPITPAAGEPSAVLTQIRRDRPKAMRAAA